MTDEMAEPDRDRRPTIHERRAGRPWDASYLDGPAPWDIGRPQEAIASLADAGAFAGAVLDAGCGTGEHSLLLAALGLPVLGVDVAPTAIAIAQAKAARRGLDAEFRVADALHLSELGRVFDRVLDCGLFHSFEGEERFDYVTSLASVTKPGGAVEVLCFSDADPRRRGPHPVSEEELREPFERSGAWNVVSVTPSRIETNFDGHGFPAWLAKAERIQRRALSFLLFAPEFGRALIELGREDATRWLEQTHDFDEIWQVGPLPASA